MASKLCRSFSFDQYLTPHILNLKILCLKLENLKLNKMTQVFMDIYENKYSLVLSFYKPNFIIIKL